MCFDPILLSTGAESSGGKTGLPLAQNEIRMYFSAHAKDAQ
jgi:hypothetical protein